MGWKERGKGGVTVGGVGEAGGVLLFMRVRNLKACTNAGRGRGHHVDEYHGRKQPFHPVVVRYHRLSPCGENLNILQVGVGVGVRVEVRGNISGDDALTS